MQIRPSVLFSLSLRRPVLLQARIRSKHWLADVIRDLPREARSAAESPELQSRIAAVTNGRPLSEECREAVIAKIVDRKTTSFTTALMFMFILRNTAEKRTSRLRDARDALKAVMRIRDDPRMEDFYKTALYNLMGCDLEDEYDDAPVKDQRAAEFLLAADIMYLLFRRKADVFKPEVLREIRQGETVVRRGQTLDKAYARDLQNGIFDPFRTGWLRSDSSGACYDKIGAIGEYVARAAFLQFRDTPALTEEDKAEMAVLARFSGQVSLALQIGEDDIKEIHEDLRAGTPNTLMWVHLREHAGLEGLDILDTARRARSRAQALLRESRDLIRNSAICNKKEYEAVLTLADEIIAASKPKEIA